ncbi:tRNA 2-selenouridine(34) synthase MnmH [Lentibacillus sp. Marseille-P4043]|uniref:tRNA 2-selenouridine(34) synthase MnmH n=1 Tax=Lentibacillus sp. Marseille-P4043 TaxID=2040293 RepID=UPI000D0BD935|nr:tRNA 2-selenouridine(34) synthase MnmH [Lentibacillus sp. Marseille-P4043]
MFQDIALQDLFALQNKESHALIDVRSPKEYHDATIPGSINIPIFTNDERAEVGTIYKQVGPEAAKERGLEIFSAKLPDFIAEFRKIEAPKTVFCWRGGMRSKTAATVLDLMGVKATRLTGGFRTYRQWVVNELDKQNFKPDLYVLNGYTGTGKTAILKQLSENGYPVLDLEGMASHRGSIFGQIGLEPSNQKKFESQLVQKMLDYQDASFVFLEGESKRIGKVTLPDFLYEKKEKGMQLFIDLPVEERIKNILDDYQPWNSPEAFLEAFQIIKKRIHTPIAKEIDEDLQNGDYSQAVKLLLEYYYDPRYEYAAQQYPDNKKVHIHAKNVEDALQKIEEIMGQLYPQHVQM